MYIFTPNTLIKSSEVNANFSGLASGSEILSGAITNAKLNTTTGELGGAWQSFTPTCTGWSGTPTTSGTGYTKIGKTIFYRFIVSGTSNSASVKVGLPVNCKNNSNFNTEASLGLAQDNGVYVTNACRMYLDPASDATVVFCQKDMVSGAWTASGAKLVRGLVIYEAA